MTTQRKIMKQFAQLLREDCFGSDYEITFLDSGAAASEFVISSAVASYAINMKMMPHVIVASKSAAAICNKMARLKQCCYTYVAPDDIGTIDAKKIAAAIRQSTCLISAPIVLNGVINNIVQLMAVDTSIPMHVEATNFFGVSSLNLKQISPAAITAQLSHGGGVLFLENTFIDEYAIRARPQTLNCVKESYLSYAELRDSRAAINAKCKRLRTIMQTYLNKLHTDDTNDTNDTGESAPLHRHTQTHPSKLLDTGESGDTGESAPPCAVAVFEPSDLKLQIPHLLYFSVRYFGDDLHELESEFDFIEIVRGDELADFGALPYEMRRCVLRFTARPDLDASEIERFVGQLRYMLTSC